MKSDGIAQFRQQQALLEGAAWQGLQGLSLGMARHDFIEARMQRGAEYILQLIKAGKHEEAQRLMATKNWGQEELKEQEDENA